MKKHLARIKVILSALPTWLAVAALVAPIVAEEAATVLPTPWSERLTAVALTVVAVCTAVVSVIRRVTPVIASARGVLPPEASADGG